MKQVPWFYPYRDMKGFNSEDPATQSNRFNSALLELMGVPSWNDIKDLEEGRYDDVGEEDGETFHDPGVVKGAERVIVIEDFFGWDFVLRMPDGHLVLTDRNCGGHMISETSYSEEELRAKIETLMRDFPHHFNNANV